MAKVILRVSGELYPKAQFRRCASAIRSKNTGEGGGGLWAGGFKKGVA